MTILAILFLLFVPPDTVNLTTLYREAEQRYPRQQEVGLRNSIADLRIANLDARLRPSLSLNGQGIYVTDVPEVPSAPSGSRSIARDQYRLSVNLDQIVYDGGRISSQKRIEFARRDIAQQEVAVEAYKLREQVNQSYFGVLLAQTELASLDLLANDIEIRLKMVRAQVANGTVLESNAEALEAELVQIEQRRRAIDAQRLAGLAALDELTGKRLQEDVVFELPDVTVDRPAQPGKARREHQLFDLNRRLLGEQQALTALQTRPNITAFTEVAYGRPQGNNFFNDTFGPFASAGIRLRWGFWDWGTSARESSILAHEQKIIDAQEASFDQGIAIASSQQLEAIRGLERVLARDEEVIALRRQIVAEFDARLRNGVVSATDYLIERNALHQAQLTRDQHRIELEQAKIVYLTTHGAL